MSDRFLGLFVLDLEPSARGRDDSVLRSLADAEGGGEEDEDEDHQGREEMDEEKRPTNLEEFRDYLMSREKQAFEAGVSTGFIIAALICAAGIMLWSYYR